jgi:hypothetical protein
MISTVTLKSDATTSAPEEKSTITLTSPTVVTLHFGPEEVVHYNKVGYNLVLVLQNGQKITIVDFFDNFEDGRNDIVFLDENGVTWWGQYSEPWDAFHIAEIEHDILPAAFGVGGLAPILGLLGAAIAAGAGGGAVESEAATPPVAKADEVAVKEAGIVNGGNTPEVGVPKV